MPVLGNLFLQAARRPLTTSSERFAMNFLGDGVRAVSSANLSAALDEGVAAVAAAVGMTPAAVRAVLPVAEISSLGARIDEHHAATLLALRPGELTVTAFHQPSGKVSPATHMVDIAGHFAKDKSISGPLRALAGEIASWEELIGACATAIRENSAISNKYARTQRMRLLARRGLAVGIAGAGIAVLAVVVTAHRAREAEARARDERAKQEHARQTRIDLALGGADPCVALDDADLGHTTPDQRQRLSARQTECAKVKEKERRASECKTVIDAVAAGGETFPAGFAADAPLLGRIAKKALAPEDLRLDALPCDEGGAMGRLFSEAALQSPEAFGKSAGPSARVARLLANVTLPPKLAATVAFRAEIIANTAIRSGITADLEGAGRMCAMKQQAKLAVGMGCRVLLSRQDPAP